MAKAKSNNLIDIWLKFARGNVLEYPTFIDRISIIEEANALIKMVYAQKETQDKIRQRNKLNDIDFYYIYNYPKTSELYKTALYNLQQRNK